MCRGNKAPLDPKGYRMNVMVLDTETTSTNPSSGIVPELMRVYDLGWVISDMTNDFTEVECKNYALMETFANASIMRTAYYCDKLPWYYEGMRQGAMSQLPIKETWESFNRTCGHNNITQVWAYNCRFDFSALNATIKAASNGWQNAWFPQGVQVLDIMSAAIDLVCDADYQLWARTNHFVTPKGNPKATAEVVYNYITGVMHDEREDFYIENHTALDDARIESRILKECFNIDPDRTIESGRKWGKRLKTK